MSEEDKSPPEEQLLDPFLFHKALEQEVQNAYKNKSPLGLTFIQDSMAPLGDKVSEILKMFSPADIKGNRGGIITIISRKSPEELIKLVLGLKGAFPSLTIGLKIYDRKTDISQSGSVSMQAEHALKTSLHTGGKIGVAGPYNEKEFTPEEKQQLEPVTSAGK